MHAHTPKSVLYSTLQLIIAQHFLHLLNLNKCTATALSAFFAAPPAAAAICLSYFGQSADMLSYKKFTTVISELVDELAPIDRFTNHQFRSCSIAMTVVFSQPAWRWSFSLLDNFPVCLIFENEAKFMDTGRRKCIICQGCIFFKY
ncbi:hypothetical protein T08_16769 [Trichinella sp. T8]|nr:hypothetical protein T08_16769 [Trichinella sp. T8]